MRSSIRCSTGRTDSKYSSRRTRSFELHFVQSLRLVSHEVMHAGGSGGRAARSRPGHRHAGLILVYGLIGLLARRLPEFTFDHVVHVRVHGAVTPQPAHHVREDGATELLAVEIHPPRVVYVIT